VPGGDLVPALAELDGITRRLRRECPWDREQDERSIVPHTVEEAYELADAAHAGDDDRLLDELGDVLFQVFFLSLLLEERGAGTLAAVARHCSEKLVRRHPHVFGDTEVRDADEVRRNWDAIKRAEGGPSRAPLDEVPDNLPALLRARRLQRRAGGPGQRGPDVATAARELHGQVNGLEAASEAGASPGSGQARAQRFDLLGDALFSAVALARALDVDPELALREAGERFRRRGQERPSIEPVP
jgi:MazG family protein